MFLNVTRQRVSETLHVHNKIGRSNAWGSNSKVTFLTTKGKLIVR